MENILFVIPTIILAYKKECIKYIFSLKSQSFTVIRLLNILNKLVYSMVYKMSLVDIHSTGIIHRLPFLFILHYFYKSIALLNLLYTVQYITILLILYMGCTWQSG